MKAGSWVSRASAKYAAVASGVLSYLAGSKGLVFTAFIQRLYLTRSSEGLVAMRSCATAGAKAPFLLSRRQWAKAHF